MSKKTFIFDARLPVSEETTADNPNHPKNLSRGMVLVSNQALADTKYDIYPPPRVAAEGFVNPEKEGFILLVVFGAIFFTLILILLSRSTYLRIACIIILTLSINYAIHLLENRTV